MLQTFHPIFRSKSLQTSSDYSRNEPDYSTPRTQREFAFLEGRRCANSRVRLLMADYEQSSLFRNIHISDNIFAVTPADAYVPVVAWVQTVAIPAHATPKPALCRWADCRS